MPHPRIEPVEFVIQSFKGVRATARALGIADPTVISKWRKQGSIPSSRQKAILDKAEELGLDITALDLIRGRAMGGA